MFDAGLAGVYQSHTMYGTFPLLRLRGSLIMDVLMESPLLQQAAHQLGLMVELWGGETVMVRSPSEGHFLLDTQDELLESLLRCHFGLAARLLEHNLGSPDHDEQPDPDAAAWLEDLDTEMDILSKVTLPEIPIRELSRAERLDRARALRGKRVKDPAAIRNQEARLREQEKSLLMSPGGSASVTEEDQTFDEDDMAMLEQLYRIMRAEGTVLDEPHWRDLL